MIYVSILRINCEIVIDWVMLIERDGIHIEPASIAPPLIHRSDCDANGQINKAQSGITSMFPWKMKVPGIHFAHTLGQRLRHEHIQFQYRRGDCIHINVELGSAFLMYST